jgi:hypothetical protein
VGVLESGREIVREARVRLDPLAIYECRSPKAGAPSNLLRDTRLQNRTRNCFPQAGGVASAKIGAAVISEALKLKP